MIAEKVDSAITIWSKRLGLILLGWFASSAYHGTLQLSQKAHTLDVVEQRQIPALKAKVGCEHWRANVATTVAKQAIAGANSDIAPIPDPKTIPADRCDTR